MKLRIRHRPTKPQKRKMNKLKCELQEQARQRQILLQTLVFAARVVDRLLADPADLETRRAAEYLLQVVQVKPAAPATPAQPTSNASQE
jgi:hypothetical protein